ncbi:hypothetical protein [Kribbella sp. NPDC048928]|uniref:hypothetical protein n=1 Tax=Kribbella sp. NPDC048928 TaxID=3364111 RepID=UPI00371F6B26
MLTWGTADRVALLIHADPSRYVSRARARELEDLGFAVRSVAGAGHCVWYGHLEEFLEALDDLQFDR